MFDCERGGGRRSERDDDDDAGDATRRRVVEDDADDDPRRRRRRRRRDGAMRGRRRRRRRERGEEQEEIVTGRYARDLAYRRSAPPEHVHRPVQVRDLRDAGRGFQPARPAQNLGDLVPYQAPDASWEDVPDEVIDNSGASLAERTAMKRAKREAIERAVKRAARGLTPVGRLMDLYDLARWLHEHWPASSEQELWPFASDDPFAVSKDLKFQYECCQNTQAGVTEWTGNGPGTCFQAGWQTKANSTDFAGWSGWSTDPGVFCPIGQGNTLYPTPSAVPGAKPYYTVWVKWNGTTQWHDAFRKYQNLAYPAVPADPAPVVYPLAPVWPEPVQNPYVDPLTRPGEMPRPWNWPVPRRGPDRWPNPLQVPGHRRVSGEPRLRRLPFRQTRRLTITVPPKGPPRLAVREVGPRLPRVPPTRERERKWVVSRSLPYLIFGSVTEGIDAIEALWQALPESCQTGRGATQKAMDVYRCFDEIDPLEAIENFLLMELEDTLVGLPSPRTPRGPGDPFGWETGPWDEGGPQPPGMDFPDSPIDWLTDMYEGQPPGLL